MSDNWLFKEFKEKIIKEEFTNFTEEQVAAVRLIIDGYVNLIGATTFELPSKNDAQVLSNIIKSNIYIILNISEVYVGKS